MNKFIELKNKIKKAESNSFFLLFLHKTFIGFILFMLGPKKFIKLKYKNRTGKRINLDCPKTYNEKLQWLKLNYFQPFYRICCDKYLIREYLEKKLHRNFSPSLLFVSKNYKDFSLTKISQFPCIIKISNGSGQNLIINDKNQFSERQIKRKIKLMLYEASIHSTYGCEPQYNPKAPFIIVEKLLLTKDGKLPNDFKLMFNNGILQYVYCSVDRLGANVRHLYDENWNRINGLFLESADEKQYNRAISTQSLECPLSFSNMKKIGAILSKDFPTVRIDFYDLDGAIFIGEITLHHGGGFDSFYPNYLDEKFGSTLVLPQKNYSLRRKNK